jgi:hypothetical protein
VAKTSLPQEVGGGSDEREDVLNGVDFRRFPNAVVNISLLPRRFSTINAAKGPCRRLCCFAAALMRIFPDFHRILWLLIVPRNKCNSFWHRLSWRVVMLLQPILHPKTYYWPLWYIFLECFMFRLPLIRPKASSFSVSSPQLPVQHAQKSKWYIFYFQ